MRLNCGLFRISSHTEKMKTTKARKHTLAVSFIVLFSIGTLLGSILILPEGNSYKDKSNHTVLSNDSENSTDNTLSAEKSSDAEDSKPSESSGADPEQTNSGDQNGAGEGADSSQNSENQQNMTVPAPSDADSTDDASHYAYLTFDDGPSRNTEAILQILKENEIKATFFVTGHTDEASMQRYREIVNAGHTLAMHSYTHNYKEIYASADAFLADYERISALIEEITGSRPTLYRFPGGSSNTLKSRKVTISELIGLLEERGIQYFDWNVNSADASGKNPNPDALIQNVASGLKYQHNIILMHDAAGHETTVQALPGIIQECRSRNLVFATITQDTPPAHHSRRD